MSRRRQERGASERCIWAGSPLHHAGRDLDLLKLARLQRPRLACPVGRPVNTTTPRPQEMANDHHPALTP